MRVLSVRSVRRLCALLLLAGAAAVAGCGDPNAVGKTVPVSGKVLFGGAPLQGGMVVFHPDQGNTSKFAPQGNVGADGTYTLSTITVTGTVKGAPLGKYKVTVNTNMPTMGTDAAPKPVAIDPIYNDAARTPLTVEVVEAPQAGAYDLPLKK